ncbi:hypothetical protein [Rhizobium mongolense]|uniref:Uncharacterized protein n=2 Tax=Rhizobium mongolense TaxID=57676 RepID=A0ABR6IZQ4_9HYPH|nr:hypothetical protein [Rhizobium mongolense]MBB4233248.1 hypothetical protein [Rhizobium mongolense]TVZ74778.1 hypothetical protein BCL32_0090 [Rhizobium mongolense USDA 1844]
MPIRLRTDAPAEGHSAITDAIADLVEPAADDGLGGGVGLDLSDPIPVYLLGLDRIKAADPLGHVELVAWRYLLERPDNAQVAYADVQQRDAKAEFVSVTGGDVAAALLEAAHRAEAYAATRSGDVEIRLLEVPSVKLSAIWLVDGTDVFIPYIDGNQQSQFKWKTVSRDAVLKELADRAKFIAN